MDGLAVDTQVLGSERSSDHRNLLRYGRWAVRELIISHVRAKWLWEECNHHHTLFSDFTIGDVDNFYNLLTSPHSFWMEVIEIDTGKRIGVVYMTNMNHIIDADVHIIFFDRWVPSKRARLCKEIAKWIFWYFVGLKRLTATIPRIYFRATMLCQMTGFKEEGQKRSSILLGNQYVNEIIFGLLREEV